ncbi:MAG: beta-lactamase class C [Arenicella sp.]|jgi:beta-lactamase class C
MKKIEPICKVGACYAYQNVGFNMVAASVSEADSKNYRDSVSSRLFEP